MADALILSRLHYTLWKLRALPTAHYDAEAKHLLRKQLSATINDIHTLYPDGLAAVQRYRLLHNLTVLQNQFMAISPGGAVPVTMWPAVHQALTTSIETTLADVAEAQERDSSSPNTIDGSNRPN
jgi:hypothetical protein